MELPHRHVPVHENDLAVVCVLLDEAMKAGLLPADMVQPVLTSLDNAVESVNLAHFRALMGKLDEEGWEPGGAVR